MNIAIVGSLFVLFFIGLEIWKRHSSIDVEYTRKVAHMCGGIAVIIGSHYLNRVEYVILTVLFLCGSTITYRTRSLQSLRVQSRISFGEITYMLGLILIGVVGYEERNIFTSAILILALPDAIAGLVGYRLKKDTKSIIGFSTYFFVSWGILSFFIPIHVSWGIALLLATVEFYSPYGLDNLTVPAVYCGIVHFFNPLTTMM